MRYFRAGEAHDSHFTVSRSAVWPRSIVTFTLACTVLIWPDGEALGEMSDEDYGSGKVIQSAAERARIAKELELRRHRETQDMERRATEERARLERDAETRARLPPGERLMRERCATCHTLAVTDGIARGSTGWRFTVERMRWWHGTRLGRGESALIAKHLHSTHPTDTVGVWKESAALAAVGSLLLALPVAIRCALKRQRQTS